MRVNCRKKLTVLTIYYNSDILYVALRLFHCILQLLLLMPISMMCDEGSVHTTFPLQYSNRLSQNRVQSKSNYSVFILI